MKYKIKLIFKIVINIISYFIITKISNEEFDKFKNFLLLKVFTIENFIKFTKYITFFMFVLVSLFSLIYLIIYLLEQKNKIKKGTINNLEEKVENIISFIENKYLSKKLS